MEHLTTNQKRYANVISLLINLIYKTPHPLLDQKQKLVDVTALP